MLLKSISILTCLVFPFYLFCQDPLFSQFFNTQTFTNPAFTAIDGGMSVNAQYRNQWNQIPGLFETKYISVEGLSSCLKTGFGAFVAHDEEGEGYLNTVTAGLNFSYAIPIQQNNVIRLGLSSYYFQKWIDWDALIFSDQLHPKEGIYPNSFSQAERLYDLKPSALGFKAGFLHRIDFKRRGKDAGISYGGGITHLGNIQLTEAPPDGFYNKVGIPWRFNLFGAFSLPFMRYEGPGYLITLIPQFRYDRQSEIKVTTVGFTWHYNLFELGFFYQNVYPWAESKHTDAMIGYLGYTYVFSRSIDLNVGVSYDSNAVARFGSRSLGGLTGGIVELNLSMHFKGVNIFCKSKRTPNLSNKVKCPRISASHKRKYNRSFHKSPNNKNLN